MKTLNFKLNESLNESFSSQFMKDVSKQDLWKNIKDDHRINFAWDKLTDNDFEDIDVKTALRLSKTETTNLIFWFDKDYLNGVSNGSWYLVRAYRGKEEFKSTTALSKQSTRAVIIKRDALKKYSTDEIRNQRWVSKNDEYLYNNSYVVKENNLNRYKLLISKNKLNQIPNYEIIKEKFDDINKKYQSMFNDLLGSPDWYKITQFNKNYEVFLKLFDDYVFAKKQVDNNNNNFIQKMIDCYTKLNDLHNTIMKENNEQLS